MTGVQTCALPICSLNPDLVSLFSKLDFFAVSTLLPESIEGLLSFIGKHAKTSFSEGAVVLQQRQFDTLVLIKEQIGRASCRESV